MRYYDTVVEVYHDTQMPTALYNKITLLHSRDKTRDALDEIAKFLQRYPNDQHAKGIGGVKGFFRKSAFCF